MKKTYKQILALCLALVMALALFTGCASQPAADDTAKPADSASADTNTPADTAADPQTGDGKDVTITMAMVNCPVVQKLSELTKEYYKAEGVNIVIDVLEEENLRTKVTNMVTTGDNTYDLFMLGAYELATWINYGWLADLTPYMEAKSAEEMAAYDRDDYKDLSYAQKTVEAINGAKFKLDGNPCNGNQFLAIPEYAELGDYMTEQMAACIAGSESIDDALSNCNDYFNEENMEETTHWPTDHQALDSRYMKRSLARRAARSPAGSGSGSPSRGR